MMTPMAEHNDNPRPEDLDAADSRDRHDASRGGQGDEQTEWDISDADVDAVNTGNDSPAILRTELAEERSRNLRLMADFQNFQRRAKTNENVARQTGVSSVVSSIVTVLDHFDIALAQDTSKASAQQIVDGVRVIRDELIRSLARHGVHIEAPLANDLFVPGKHEAIMQQAAEGVDSGHIVATFQAGFILREGDVERVIRPAKVSVAP